MTKELINLTFEVIDQENGVARVIGGNATRLPSDEITAQLFTEYPTGTLIEATIRRTERSISFMDHKVISPQGQAAAIEEQAGEWVKVSSEYFSPEEYTLFDTIMRVLDFEQQFNLLVVGPSGFGKSSRARAWAKANGMKYLRKDCSLIRDPEEMFGYRELTEKGTVFVATDLTDAIREGNVVVLLDEFNRAEPWLLNSLFPILDFERRTVVHNEVIEVGPNVIFIATANIGLQYVGTFMMDKALTNRFSATIAVGAPPSPIERTIVKERYGLPDDDCEIIVNLLNTLREQSGEALDASTRTALKLAALVKAGMSLRQAAEYALINATEFESRKEIRDIVNSELGVR